MFASKRITMRSVLGALLFLGLAVTAFAAERTISYTVRVSDPKDGRFHVQMSFFANSGPLRVFMPVFTPGSLLQNNARFVSRISCTAGSGKVVPIARVTKDEWDVISPAAGQLTVTYDVLPNTFDSLGLTTNSLGARGGFFQGTTIFLGVRGLLDIRATLKLELLAGWKIATTLAGADGSYRAANYAELVKAPVQFGEWTERDVTAGGMKVRLVFDAPLPPYDEAQLDDRITKIIEHHVKLFGSAPFRDYLVLFHWRPDLPYGGGVSRRSAMVMNVGKEWMDDLTANLGGTFAHEMFHAWNFSSFYPRPLRPPDYLKPEYTASTWFTEGVTNYYVLRAFAKIGRSPRLKLMAWISQDITEFENSPARGWMSLEEADIASWSEPVESLPMNSGGNVAGLILDLAIRRETGNRASLDDVVRQLYKDSTARGYEGFTETSLRQTVNRVAGRDLTPVMDAIVRSKDRCDYSVLLRGSGLSVKITKGPNGRSFDLELSASLTEAQRRALDDIFSDR